MASRIPTYTTAPNPPLNPEPCDLWFNATTGYEFVWYDDGNTKQWVTTNTGKAAQVPVTTDPFYVPGTGRANSLASRFGHDLDARDFLPVGVSYASIVNGANNTDLKVGLQAAIDQAWTDAGNGLANRIVIPRGTWFVEPVGGGLRTPSTTTGFSRIGIQIVGEGPETILTQKRFAGTDVVDYSDPLIYVNQALLRIFGSNVTVDSLSFDGCINAIYMGQDPASGSGSEVSFCRLARLIIANCGTGIHQACSVGPAQGTKYNSIERTHIYQVQIGVHLREIAPVIANNNRQSFRDVRVARSRMGWWIENGGTNQFEACHCESNHALGNTPYPMPAGTPNGLSWAIALGADGTDNDFISCFLESNSGGAGDGGDLYNNGAQNRFVGGVINPAVSEFPVRPLRFSSYTTLWVPDQYHTLYTGAVPRTDIFQNAIPGVDYAERSHIFGSTPFSGPAGPGTPLPSNLAAVGLFVSAPSSSRQLGALSYGASATFSEIFGAKNRGATPDSLTVPNVNDVLLDVHGRAADGVSTYVKGAGLQIVALSAPSPTNAHSGFNILAVGAASVARVISAAFRAVASAVNYLQHTSNIAGGVPFTEALGTDTNIGWTVALKGAGAWILRMGGISGGNAIVVEGEALATSALRITPGNAANALRVGSSTGDMKLAPATGIVAFNQTFAAASVPANFTAANMLQIKDNAGTVYYIPCRTATW